MAGQCSIRGSEGQALQTPLPHPQRCAPDIRASPGTATMPHTFPPEGVIDHATPTNGRRQRLGLTYIKQEVEIACGVVASRRRSLDNPQRQRTPHRAVRAPTNDLSDQLMAFAADLDPPTVPVGVGMPSRNVAINHSLSWRRKVRPHSRSGPKGKVDMAINCAPGTRTACGTDSRFAAPVVGAGDHAASLISASIRIRSNGTHTPPLPCRTSPNRLSTLTSS